MHHKWNFFINSFVYKTTNEKLYSTQLPTESPLELQDKFIDAHYSKHLI